MLDEVGPENNTEDSHESGDGAGVGDAAASFEDEEELAALLARVHGGFFRAHRGLPPPVGRSPGWSGLPVAVRDQRGRNGRGGRARSPGSSPVDLERPTVRSAIPRGPRGAGAGEVRISACCTGISAVRP